MADNGYLKNGICYPSAEFALRSCLDSYPSTYSAAMWITYGNSPTQMRCLSTSGVYYDLPKPSGFNCEISGPPLSEIQQIEAVNALFPSAVAILATAWGFKVIRRMIYEWLHERNRDD